MNDPCPLCDVPIADTGYVCHRCTRGLARDLLRTATLWRSIEDAIGRGLLIDRPPSHPTSADRRAWAGPWCEGADCEHPSCQRAWWAWAHRAEEPPAGREDPILLDLGAVETAWVAGQTFAAWAQLVADVRGTPIPHLDPPVHVELEVGPVDELVREARRRWCEYGDLPAVECACGNPNATHPRRMPA